MKVDKTKFEIAMANACMNTDEVARNSGISRISINKYLSGKREPRPKTLGNIAKALNVAVTDIIEN